MLILFINIIYLLKSSQFPVLSVCFFIIFVTSKTCYLLQFVFYKTTTFIHVKYNGHFTDCITYWVIKIIDIYYIHNKKIV